MKKRMLWVLLATCLLLPMLARAEKTVEVSGHLMCAAGEPRVAAYPDLSGEIGQGLTLADFDVTYSSASPYVTVYEDGSLFISEAAGMFSNLPLTVTYTPRAAGVGETTHFRFTLRTSYPLTGLTADVTELYMTQGPNELIDIEVEGGANQSAIADIRYDADVISVARTDYGSTLTTLQLVAVAPGKTEVVVTGYNGIQASVQVTVLADPTQVAFAQDHFECFVGDEINLGLDLGNGPEGTQKYPASTTLRRSGLQVMPASDYFAGRGVFKALQSGEYEVEISAGGYRGKTGITVYDNAVCEEITLSAGLLYQHQEGIRVQLYDENGQLILLPMRITGGGDIAELIGRDILATGEGEVEITVDNADGTTTTATFQVQAVPEAISLNAEELTLEIGERFDVQVSFDKGAAPYTLTLEYDDPNPAFELYPVVLADGTLTAQAPGTATLIAKAGELTAECRVTVPDSDLAVRLVVPEDVFCVGDTFQLAVVDRTGKTYPAVFLRSGSAVSLTSDGLMTGMEAGSVQIGATLEDGRVLRYRLQVEKWPSAISHPDMTVHENYTTAGLGGITSDVGTVNATEVSVSVADESIATYDFPFFTFYQAGETEVTLTALNGGATTTFTLTVLRADDTLYAEQSTLEIPSGYYTTMPTITDYYGETVQVTWEMTYHVPGQGNPDPEGFILDGDVIICLWSSAYCQVTGTSATGATIVIDVWGYRLAEEVVFPQEEYEITVGESLPLSVSCPVQGDRLGPVYWFVKDDSIASFSQPIDQTEYGVVTGLKPGTTFLTAVLLNGQSASCIIRVVSANLPGDANDDGRVDFYDALLIQQLCAGWGGAVNRDNADVNGSGGVDIYDALLILKDISGQDVTLQ